VNTNYRVLRALSMVVGLALVAIGAFLNASKAAEVESWTSPICAAIIALAFGSAVAVSVMVAAWHGQRKGLAAFAFVGLVCGEAYSLQLSAERLLASREARALQVVQSGGASVQAKAALDSTIEERKKECSSGFGKNCQKLRELEETQRAKLGALKPPGKTALLADATGLPEGLVEIVPALLFSVALQILAFVLVGFGGHRSHHRERAVQPVGASTAEPSESEDVVSWVKAYRQRHGRNPSIPEVQKVFDLPKTTAWRRATS
jgi:hypothetical protein